MRSLFNKTRISRAPQSVEAASFYEYQSEVKWGPEHHENPLTPRGIETTVFVVFDGETRHHFSSARIVLYCDKAKRIEHDPPWVQQLGSVNHNIGCQVHPAPPNDSTLPQLTVAFKVVPVYEPYRSGFDLILQSSDHELRNRRHKSVHVLLDSELAMTPDTVSLSVAFEHTTRLQAVRRELKYCCEHRTNLMYSGEYGIIRIVRVVPEDITRLRTATRRLPMELLIKIFEDIDSCEWQHDLLSVAQVCRRWSCSLRVFFARMECPEMQNYWYHSFRRSSSHTPDPYALAKAFTKTPALGLGIRRLILDEHVGLWRGCVSRCRRMPTGVTPALVAILRATKDLQHLHISQLYSSRANTIFSALPDLSDLRTLTITRSNCPLGSWPEDHRDSISTLQLARCMARWPTLSSLTVEYLVQSSLGMQRFFLRPPACALTKLCIRNTYISDADLLYLTASSASTLVQVTLDHLSITPAGLHAFLDSISQQVISLRVFWREGLLTIDDYTEHPLDTVVDKMPCLEVLSIGGDVASECMLRRRSEMFARSCSSSGNAAVPVVRLSATYVPWLKGCIRGKEWPGWQMVKIWG